MKLITQIRKDRGLSMSELARMAKMHVSSVSQIESGRLMPYPGQAKKLSDALGWNGETQTLFKEV